MGGRDWRGQTCFITVQPTGSQTRVCAEVWLPCSLSLESPNLYSIFSFHSSSPCLCISFQVFFSNCLFFPLHLSRLPSLTPHPSDTCFLQVVGLLTHLLPSRAVIEMLSLRILVAVRDSVRKWIRVVRVATSSEVAMEGKGRGMIMAHG